MRYHPECRQWRAPGHRARVTVDQTSLPQAEHALEFLPGAGGRQFPAFNACGTAG